MNAEVGDFRAPIVDRLVQHWTHRHPGDKAIGVVRCEACQQATAAAYDEGTPMPGYVVKLSPSAARKRRCFVCGARTGGPTDG